MKCTKCNKNEATVYYREVVNGKETKYALCPECAAKAEKEMNESIFDSFYQPFGTGLLGSLFSGKTGLAQKNDAKRCTLCGATFKELCDDGRTGCPECYRVFREELSPTVTRLHGSAAHTGRAPGKFKAKRENEKKVAALKKELKTAVAEERYEDAARLRDEINGMNA